MHCFVLFLKCLKEKIKIHVINQNGKEHEKDIYIYIYVCVCMCVFIYIFIERERDLNQFVIQQQLTQYCKSTILQ